MSISVVTRQAILDAFNRLAAAGGQLVATKVGLFSNDITPTRDTTVADLVPVVAAGLEEQDAIAWGPSFDPGDGDPEITATIVPFVATGVGLPIAVNGWYALNTAGTQLEACEKFDNPIVIDQAGDGVDFVPRIKWGSA